MVKLGCSVDSGLLQNAAMLLIDKQPLNLLDQLINQSIVMLGSFRIRSPQLLGHRDDDHRKGEAFARAEEFGLEAAFLHRAERLIEDCFRPRRVFTGRPGIGRSSEGGEELAEDVAGALDDGIPFPGNPEEEATVIVLTVGF